MTEDIQVAKDLFMKYGGSHFFMDREGEYSEYQRFNIPRDRELEWIQEYRSELLAKLEADPTDSDVASAICRTVSYYQDFAASRPVVDIATRRSKELDSFSKLRYAEEFHRLLQHPTFDGGEDVRSVLRRAARDLLQKLLGEPITVAPHYKKLSYLRECLTKQAITDRAEKEMNRLNCEQSSRHVPK